MHFRYQIFFYLLLTNQLVAMQSTRPCIGVICKMVTHLSVFPKASRNSTPQLLSPYIVIQVPLGGYDYGCKNRPYDKKTPEDCHRCEGKTCNYECYQDIPHE